MKTFSAKKDEVTRHWMVVDAQGQTLGRLAGIIANVLRGKNKPEFTPQVDTGDFVIVINADKIQVSGKKASQNLYRHHTGFLGGLKTINFEGLLQKSPEKVIRHAVWGMVPHSRLGHQQIKKLYVYAGSEHPHIAQNPQVLSLAKEATA